MSNANPSVFISYSHEDKRWMKRVLQQLGVLEKDKRLAVWHDESITAGADWLSQLKRAMQGAQAAVLLVSPAFLTSKFVLENEVSTFLEGRARIGLRVFPVLIRPCPWEKIGWLERMQLKTGNSGKSLSELPRAQADRVLAELAKEILGALERKNPPRSALPPPTLPSSVERPCSTVHQLPAPPLDFTGRAAELEDLKAAVREGKTTAIFGVRGMGGVGKTALALKLANEVEPFYPDGQIYLDLLGVTTPLSSAEAMAHVIRSFDPERRPPASEAELAAMYRSVLHGKRVLLLMDNAAAKEQVEPLIPPAGSALLVTSRTRFSLPGLRATNLDKLPRKESRELVLQICPRIGEYAETLAQACGDLPLALRVAASMLEERQTLSPESYLQRLSAGREHLEPFDQALSLSYKLLSKRLRRFWCQLAVFPDTFDQKAAAAVWRVDLDAAAPILAELEKNSLVEWEDTGERYRLHDLVRSFVNGRLEETEKRSSWARHAWYYLEVLGSADDLCLRSDDNLIHGLKLFDLERRNIQAGQALAATLATQSDEGARLCSEYSRVGVQCRFFRQTPRERITWLENALAAARRLKDREAEERHLSNLGDAYFDLGEPRRALESYEEVLAIVRKIEDRRREGTILGRLGLVYEALGEPRRAVELCEQHLAIAREVGDRRGEGYALGSLGVVHQALGESRRARELYEQSIAIARELGNRHGEALASWSLGLTYEQEEPARAVELMQVCVGFEREIRHPEAEADAAQVEAIRARIG